MIKALLLFRRNRSRIMDLGKIYAYWHNHVPLLNAQSEEILRAQWVMIVSAFDTFIHDCVRIGIIKTYKSRGVMSTSLQAYPIPFSDLVGLEAELTALAKESYLDCVVRKINSKDSYQSPKNVEYALNLIGKSGIWNQLSTSMHMPAADIRNQLSIIVQRRNKIAHESDLNVLGSALNSISENDVKVVIDFITKLVVGIYYIVK